MEMCDMHDETSIVYESNESSGCPLCSAEEKIQELEDKIINLKAIIEDLYCEISDLK